jgi:urate oxidase
VRQLILETFAEHSSRSVQQTPYTVGEAVVESYDEIAEIALSLPNGQCLPVDLTPFGIGNRNEIFVPTDEPQRRAECRSRIHI